MKYWNWFYCLIPPPPKKLNLCGNLTFDNQLKWSFLVKEPHGHVTLVASRVRVSHLCKFGLLVQFKVILSKQKHVSRVSSYANLPPSCKRLLHEEVLPSSTRPLLLRMNRCADRDPKFRRHSWRPFQRGLKWRPGLQARAKICFRQLTGLNSLLVSIHRIWQPELHLDDTDDTTLWTR